MSDGAITREGARRIMTNRCESLSVVFIHPLFLSVISAFSLCVSHLSPPLSPPLATHSCPARGGVEWRCTCSFLLLNRAHQSRRCLHQRLRRLRYYMCSQRLSIRRQAMLMWGHGQVFSSRALSLQVPSHAGRVSCSALVCLGR